MSLPRHANTTSATTGNPFPLGVESHSDLPYAAHDPESLTVPPFSLTKPSSTDRGPAAVDINRWMPSRAASSHHGYGGFLRVEQLSRHRPDIRAGLFVVESDSPTRKTSTEPSGTELAPHQLENLAGCAGVKDRCSREQMEPVDIGVARDLPALSRIDDVLSAEVACEV
jgi:hypothetical protein